jgi:hypothetical protein
MSVCETIIEQVLALQPADRLYIRDAIQRSLVGDGFESDELAGEWSDEIDRRLDALEQGKAELRDVAEAIADWEAKYPPDAAGE